MALTLKQRRTCPEVDTPCIINMALVHKLRGDRTFYLIVGEIFLPGIDSYRWKQYIAPVSGLALSQIYFMREKGPGLGNGPHWTVSDEAVGRNLAGLVDADRVVVH